MNEKIQDLINKSTEFISYRICQHTYKHIDDPAGTHFREEFNKEKFAELIIKECASLTLDYKNDQHYQGWIDYRDLIKEHFGIK